MRNFLLPLGLAAACLNPFSLPAQIAPPVLTLERAVARAAAYTPGVSAARHEVEAAEGALRQAGVWRNPTLNASTEDLRRDTRTTTMTVDIPLELGGKRAARMTASERALDVARAGLANAQTQARATVIAAFFQTVVAQERAQLSIASADLARRAGDVAARRVMAGKVSPVEETRAKVDLANAGMEADEAQAELEMARQALASSMGETDLSFSGVTAEAITAPMRPSISDLVAGLDASPSLAASRAEAERRRALIEVERARARPDVTVSLGGKRDSELGRSQVVVGVSLPLPFFDRNQGAIHEAAKLADKASDEVQATRLRLGLELKQASSRLSMARQSLNTLQTVVLPAAQGVYEAATKGFEAGKFGFIDVLDAQRSLLAARSRYLNTLVAAYQAAAAIDRITGQ